jgi:hypothetical protein
MSINTLYINGSIVHSYIKEKSFGSFKFLNFAIDTASGRIFTSVSLKVDDTSYIDEMNNSKFLCLFPAKFRSDEKKDESGVIIKDQFYWKISVTSKSHIKLYNSKFEDINYALISGKVSKQLNGWIVVGMPYKDVKNKIWKNDYVRVKLPDGYSEDIINKNVYIIGSCCAAINKKSDIHVVARNILQE